SDRDWSSDVCSSDLATPSSCGRRESLPGLADLLERRFVQPQQRAQLLIQRCFRHHPAAVTEREGETVQLLFLPSQLQRAQMPPRSEERRVGKECRSR